MVEKINRLIATIFFIIFWTAGCFIRPAVAASNMTIISDAETQNYLAEVVKPLYEAAGINFRANKIFVVADNSLNAFVSEGNYLFIHSGTLMNADNTNELAGILAHEIGHITGGHIVRQKLKLEKMQYLMLGSMLAAGATAASTGRGDAAMAVILGSQSSVINSMMHYQIQEERSADESAIKLLSKTKQSTAGLLKFMRKIKKQYALSGVEENPYFHTHPLTAERIRHFAETGKNNHFSAKSAKDAEFLMVKAKLTAFLADKNKVERLYPRHKNTDAALYAQSIVSLREGKTDDALHKIDVLTERQPKNPYLYELKGQILFEGGRAEESVVAYKQALKLLPDNYLLQISLAQAILENNPPKTQIQEAVDYLQKSLINTKTPMAWQLLSQAYERQNNKPAMLYAAAEFSYAIGNPETALKQLEKAKSEAAENNLKLKISDLERRIKAEMKDSR